MSKAQELSSVFDAAQSISFAAGEGIDFGAEVLDDYEEGTWTPVYESDVGFSASAVTSHECYYAKIGNVVHLYGKFLVNGTDTSVTVGNQMFVEGLPFIFEDLGDSITYIGTGFLYETLGSDTWAHLAAMGLSANPSQMIFEVVASSNNPDADEGIFFTCTYRVD